MHTISFKAQASLSIVWSATVWAAVALEMQSRQGIPRSRTFGAPVLDLNSRGPVERYRRPLDPVSILDRGARWGGLSAYPHTYTGFAQ